MLFKNNIATYEGPHWEAVELTHTTDPEDGIELIVKAPYFSPSSLRAFAVFLTKCANELEDTGKFPKGS